MGFWQGCLCLVFLGVDSSLDISLLCVGHYEMKPPILYENFMENNKCICTNGKLENEFMYLY